MFKPRPGQTEVINYTGGKMGVSAVPGSGKTHTLSFLAARLVASGELAADQEILIVTLVNSAVDNFASRVAQFLTQMGLIAGVGYRVRTLHGLAYDIVREHPGRIGLDNHFSIMDEHSAMEILDLHVRNWMQANRSILENYTHEDFRFDHKYQEWLVFLKTLAANFIKQAKDFQLTPEDTSRLAENEHLNFPFIQFAHGVYENYQQALQQRGSVDFEDLIRYAFQILENDPAFTERLRRRWPVILEDEAQDSSLIQEKLLRLLCGCDGNWVRVGDPNQAIFETFTTADPELLRAFLREADVKKYDLKYSGRSTQSIINLANQLIHWSLQEHPVLGLRGTLTEPCIHTTLPGDPQQNPADQPDQIYLDETPYSADKELITIARSLKKWIPENEDKTVAVLVPRNTRGAELAQELDKQGVPFLERLKSTKPTRDVAAILANVLDFLVHPTYKRSFSTAMKSILNSKEDLRVERAENKALQKALTVLLKNYDLERLLEERSIDWLEMNAQILPETISKIEYAQELLKKWQFAVTLPVDQLLMTISMDLFQEPADLALAHKLAVLLETGASINPSWELPDFQDQLESIAENRFSVYGFSETDMEFNPDLYPGKVVITTFHKAKGLEWDRVYLMSVNNYNFPSCQENDSFSSEKWFIRDQLNLEAELTAHLKNLVLSNLEISTRTEGEASLKARLDYCAERLRLFYVGLTRAREQLIITWNTGKRGDCVEALPLNALRRWWEDSNAH